MPGDVDSSGASDDATEATVITNVIVRDPDEHTVFVDVSSFGALPVPHGGRLFTGLGATEQQPGQPPRRYARGTLAGPALANAADFGTEDTDPFGVAIAISDDDIVDDRDQPS